MRKRGVTSLLTQEESLGRTMRRIMHAERPMFGRRLMQVVLLLNRAEGRAARIGRGLA